MPISAVQVLCIITISFTNTVCVCVCFMWPCGFSFEVASSVMSYNLHDIRSRYCLSVSGLGPLLSNRCCVGLHLKYNSHTRWVAIKWRLVSCYFTSFGTAPHPTSTSAQWDVSWVAEIGTVWGLVVSLIRNNLITDLFCYDYSFTSLPVVYWIFMPGRSGNRVTNWAAYQLSLGWCSWEYVPVMDGPLSLLPTDTYARIITPPCTNEYVWEHTLKWRLVVNFGLDECWVAWCCRSDDPPVVIAM